MVPRGLSVLPVARGSWGPRSGSGWGPMGTSKSRARTPSDLAHDLDDMTDKNPVWFCAGDSPSRSIFPMVGGKSKPFTMAFKALKDPSPASLNIEAGLSSLSHIPPLLFWRCVDLPAWTMLSLPLGLCGSELST